MTSVGDPQSVPALLALLAPGFIILWFRTRVVEGPTPDFKQQLFYFAVVSAAYYGFVGPLFHVGWGIQLPSWVWSLLLYVVVPTLGGIVIGWITERDLEYVWAEKLGMHFSHRIPTAWDFRFSRIPEGAFILVTLKDATTIAGRMAAGSFSASAKDGRDIYIKEVWEVPDSGEWRRLEPERGLLICGEEIRYVEFFGGSND